MKKSFTMAEVLITLGIIGIIAAMTLPTLIKNHQRKVVEAKLKKAYSVVSQAFLAAQAKHGEIKDWPEWDDAEEILKEYIAPEIKNAKVYGPSGEDSSNNFSVMCSDEEDIYKSHQYVWMTGVGISTPFSRTTASIKLMDVTCIGLNPKNEWSSQYLFIDINGNKPQNKKMAGTDIFFFVINENTILPYGYNWNKEDLSSTKTNACSSQATSGGQTCAALIMRNGWEITYW